MAGESFVILVVDDQPVNSKILEMILKNQGYEVLLAENGKKAREIVGRRKPDLILLDILMPVEDGFTTCEKLKEDSQTSDIPIIFISGLDEVENKVKGLTIGGWDYITKPFNREEVAARVRNALRFTVYYRQVIDLQSQRLRQISKAQQALLIQPAELPEAGFSVQYVPALEAGGDFYDAFRLGAGIFGFFVADISGHDLGASFATSALKALVRQNATLLLTPEETISTINKVLGSYFSDGQHLTAVYAILNRNNATLAVVSAAHPSILRLKAHGGHEWLESRGDVIGVFADGHYPCVITKVEPGDRFFLYSDGILEVFQGEQRTREQGMSALQTAAAGTASLILDEAVSSIMDIMCPDSVTPDDDVVLLGVEV